MHFLFITLITVENIRKHLTAHEHVHWKTTAIDLAMRVNEERCFLYMILYIKVKGQILRTSATGILSYMIELLYRNLAVYNSGISIYPYAYV